MKTLESAADDPLAAADVARFDRFDSFSATGRFSTLSMCVITRYHVHFTCFPLHAAVEFYVVKITLDAQRAETQANS